MPVGLTTIPADLAAALVPLAWLLGSWEGVGVVGYPTRDGGDADGRDTGGGDTRTGDVRSDLQFGQEITVEHDGRDLAAERVDR